MDHDDDDDRESPVEAIAGELGAAPPASAEEGDVEVEGQPADGEAGTAAAGYGQGNDDYGDYGDYGDYDDDNGGYVEYDDQDGGEADRRAAIEDAIESIRSHAAQVNTFLPGVRVEEHASLHHFRAWFHLDLQRTGLSVEQIKALGLEPSKPLSWQVTFDHAYPHCESPTCERSSVVQANPGCDSAALEDYIRLAAAGAQRRAMQVRADQERADNGAVSASTQARLDSLSSGDVRDLAARLEALRTVHGIGPAGLQWFVRERLGDRLASWPPPLVAEGDPMDFDGTSPPTVAAAAPAPEPTDDPSRVAAACVVPLEMARLALMNCGGSVDAAVAACLNPEARQAMASALGVAVDDSPEPAAAAAAAAATAAPAAAAAAGGAAACGDDGSDGLLQRLGKAVRAAWGGRGPEAPMLTRQSSVQRRAQEKHIASWNPLVTLVFAVEDALRRCSRHCLVCGKQLQLSGMKPVVCESPRCQFSYFDMGVGLNVGSFLISSPEVADLLWSAFVSCLGGTRGHLRWPEGVSDGSGEPANTVTAHSDVEQRRLHKVAMLLPEMKQLISWAGDGQLVINLNSKHRLLYPLLKWVVATTSAYVRRLKPDERVIPTLDCEQFVLRTGSLAKEAEFQALKAQSGSFFAFHGSAWPNWHSIMANGLKNYSNTKYMSAGAAMGAGIYMADSFAMSYGYSQRGRGSRGWEQSQFKHSLVMALCEVIDRKSEFTKSAKGVHVVAQEAWVVTRFLLCPSASGGHGGNISATSLKDKAKALAGGRVVARVAK